MTEEEIKRNLGRGKDLRGRVFNRLVPLFPQEKRKNRQIIWHCKCNCGNECNVIASSLISGNTQSCGCLQKEKTMQSSIKNLVGQKFNFLTVMYLQQNKRGSYNNELIWHCKCDCGNECDVRRSALVSGQIKSCGCLQKRRAYESNSKIFNKGTVFGSLTIIEQEQERKHGGLVWKCQCSCGNIVSIRSNDLIAGITKSCGHCGKNSKGNQKILKIFQDSNILYEAEKRFSDCKDIRPLPFDFYLPNYNCCIEYDGIIHYNYTNSGWNTKNRFENSQKHDQIKNQWCKDNNIILIRIPYTHYNDLCLEDLLPKTSKFLINDLKGEKHECN